MTNITDEVRDFLNKRPSIPKCFYLGVINVRALAFYIIKEIKLDASVHAVMSAIRRYQKEAVEQNKNRESMGIYKVLSESKLSTKSMLTMIRVKRHFNVLADIIPEIIRSTHVSRGEVLRLVEGRESMKFVIDNSKRDDIIKIIPKEEILEVKEHLGEINIHFSEKYGHIPGTISTTLNELAINNINIIEAIGCLPELIIIVDQKDISRCHDTLLRFFYSKE